MSMTMIAIIIFAIAAVGGLFLASKVLSGQLAPWAVSIVHALLGAAGLVTLILVVLEGSGDNRLTAALGLLVVAALGGFYLASIHMKGNVASKNIVFIHAGIAVAGFLTLLSVLF
ncbi:hypothetical protein [Nitrosomonas eutropha]|uniref:NAD(P) transhydrogenase beta subunit n=3 Tax=Nitrosomonadaceae TaxID=206379 RepID=A0ABX5MCL1_9PROT|nr:hypothetical protein [Nitrosomonas eutropha]ABI60322.1 conserved hypothetical protein [Nitrosomonas eutropha C91]PXV83726.1 hypothetical protein C8R14_10322 [Nitrosomonas eutropha]SCX17084.1 hypothetical protein SAMN05216379_11118 [Nitrosomonas eutropha]SDW52396.1 hypothetical protein SAMN05216317_10718 [Nitrosomonas eutropha]SEI53698.1 hypothetical protein SAMN05216318_10522 [Nitrosomonas eutropha]